MKTWTGEGRWESLISQGRITLEFIDRDKR